MNQTMLITPWRKARHRLGFHFWQWRIVQREDNTFYLRRCKYPRCKMGKWRRA